MEHRTFEEPAAAEAAFYDAFAAVDLAAMDQVWVRDARALCVHPGGGLLDGRQAVMQSWMEIFSGADAPVIERTLIGSYSSEQLAVHLVEERIRPRGGAGGAPNRVLATNVYVREHGSWRMAEHHASLPLVRRNSGDDDRRLH